MADVTLVFFFIAALGFGGFIGLSFFNKTRFSDFILLMVLGLLIGPVLGLIDGASLAFLRQVAPYFASLALVILLFEGGLQLNFYRVLKELPKATVFTWAVFILSVTIITGTLLVFGWTPLLAVLLGCIIGGTSSAIIVPLVNSISAGENTKTLLTIESAITDALSVITTIAVAEIMLAKSAGIQAVFQSILAAFSVAAVLGFIFGVLWLLALRDFPSIRKYEHILTLATVFFVYSVAEFARGNGAFAVLIFGIMLGNAKELGAILRIQNIQTDTSISAFQAEISLFVRTFFFVYLGAIFSAEFFRLDVIGAAAALTAGLFMARHIGTVLLTRFLKEFSADAGAIRSLMARGLAAAVLATYPASVGISDPGINLVLPLAFLVILFSNVVTTIGVFEFEKAPKGIAPVKAKKAAG